MSKIFKVFSKIFTVFSVILVGSVCLMLIWSIWDAGISALVFISIFVLIFFFYWFFFLRGKPLTMCRARVISKNFHTNRAMIRRFYIMVILPNGEQRDCLIGTDIDEHSKETYNTLKPGDIVDLAYVDALTHASIDKSRADETYDKCSARGKMASKFSKKTRAGSMLYGASFLIEKGALRDDCDVLLVLALTERQFNATEIGDTVDIQFQAYKAIAVKKGIMK